MFFSQKQVCYIRCQSVCVCLSLSQVCPVQQQYALAFIQCDDDDCFGIACEGPRVHLRNQSVDAVTSMKEEELPCLLYVEHITWKLKKKSAESNFNN